MGFTPDVVSGTTKILASWGNEIRDRTLQVFATEAERDSQWASPPDGASCVTLDKNVRWARRSGKWTPIMVSGGNIVTTNAAGGWSITFPVTFDALPNVVAVDGDSNSTFVLSLGLINQNLTTTSFGGLSYMLQPGQYPKPLASGTERISWIASARPSPLS